MPDPSRIIPGGPLAAAEEVEGMLACPNPPEPGVYARIDWIRCTGSQHLLDPVYDFLQQEAGCKHKPCSGGAHFSSGAKWSPGFMLSWGHNARVIMADVQGQALAKLGGDESIRLLLDLLAFGLKPTRIDLALDFVGQDRDIYDNAVASCEAGELLGVRKYKTTEGQTANGYPLERTLHLGSRDSPVFIRIYDKGLEQHAICPPAYWERIETEFKKERAVQVVEHILAAGPDYPARIAELVLGSMHFCENNGRTERARRPAVPWWAALREGLSPIATKNERIPSSDASFLGHMMKMMPRFREIAKRDGMTAGQLADRLAATALGCG